MKVLVLGATGFVGTQTRIALQRRTSVEVVAACRDPARLGSFDGEVRVGDLRDPTYRARVFEGIDAACFTAAWSALYGHVAASRALFLEPTLAALQAAVAAGVRRIAFTSAIDIENLATTRFRAIRSNLDRVWPHLANVLAIERAMQRLATPNRVMIPLRFGIFTGAEVSLGFLPVLLPQLARRMVPLIDRGSGVARLVDQTDIGEAFAHAMLAPNVRGFQPAGIVSPNPPTFRQVFEELHDTHGYPFPAFSVSSPLAYRFAHAAELVSRVTPWEPLLTRSIVFISEPFEPKLDGTPIGFTPSADWRKSVAAQVATLRAAAKPGRLASPLPRLLAG